jgi:hypothetical protein
MQKVPPQPYDGNKIVITDEQIDAQEKKDNEVMSSQKSKLEALQKQAPPKDPEELVQYLMKRLEAAEQSIQV